MATPASPTVEQVAAAVKEAAKTEPIIELSTGEVFKGDNWEKVARDAAKSKEDTTIALKQTKEHLEELQRQMQALQTKPAPTNGATPEFDANRYWAMVNEGKLLDAEKYKLGALFQIDPEQVVPTISTAVNKVESLWDAVEIEKFRSGHPDFPAGKETAAKLMERVKTYGGEWDATVLHRAYKDLIEEKEIEPLALEETKTAAFTALPTAEGTSALGTEDMEMLEQFASLPADKMDAVLRKLGKM